MVDTTITVLIFLDGSLEEDFKIILDEDFIEEVRVADFKDEVLQQLVEDRQIIFLADRLHTIMRDELPRTISISLEEALVEDDTIMQI